MSKPTIPLTPGNYYHIYNRGINSCPIFHEYSDYERFLYLYAKYVSPVAATLAWVLMRTHIHFLVRIKQEMVYRYSMKEIRHMEAAQNADRSGSAAISPRDATGFSLPEDNLTFAKWETVCIRDADRQDSGTSAEKFCGKRLPDVCGSDAQERLPNVSSCDKAKKTPNPSAHFGHLFNAYARYFNLKYHRHGSLLEHQFKRKPIEDDWYRRNVLVYIHKNPEHHGYYDDFRKYPWSSYLSFLTNDPGLISKEEVFEWFGSTTNYLIAHRPGMNTDALEEWLNEE